MANLFKKNVRDLTTDLLTFMGLPYGFGSASLSKMQAMQLSTVYRCVEVKSDAIATPTIILQDKTPGGWVKNSEDDLYNILNVEPCVTYSKTWLMKMLQIKKELEGNGYARIYRDGAGNPTSISLILDPVKIIIDADGILYYVIQKYKPEIIEQSDIIHHMNFSYDGIIGVSTLTHANNVLSLADVTDRHAKGYFTGGGNGAMIIKVEGSLDETKAAQIKADVAAALDATDGAPNSALVMGPRMSAEPWPAVSAREAQMLESRRFNIPEICRFFGVSPVKVFETRDSKYNTVESMQLAFLTDTAGPEFARLENEFNRKLFGPMRRRSRRIMFEISDLLRADLDSTSNYRRKMTEIGTYTADDNREFVGLPRFNKGASNVPMMPVNLQPVNSKNYGENESV